MDRTLAETPHSRSEIEAYFEGRTVGHALRVADATRYGDPVPLREIREAVPDFSPPQNFRYVDPSQSDLLGLTPADFASGTG